MTFVGTASGDPASYSSRALEAGRIAGLDTTVRSSTGVNGPG